MGWKNSHLYSFTRSIEAHHIEFILPEYDEEGELNTGNIWWRKFQEIMKVLELTDIKGNLIYQNQPESYFVKISNSIIRKRDLLP